MNNPQYVKIKDKKYKINSDFRVALKCNKVAKDSEIDDTVTVFTDDLKKYLRDRKSVV